MIIFSFFLFYCIWKCLTLHPMEFWEKKINLVFSLGTFVICNYIFLIVIT
jgi:hypothetical protein